ncbi:MAG: hypothetical protein IPH88_16620 [Bacteroidales bacterium]|nr:hypothetical protein [Bacteroidales bacterium]
MKKLILILLSLIAVIQIQAQFIPEHISNQAIYSFLDELANEGYITVNSAVKPYSRTFIAERLQTASLKQNMMSTRMRKELQFYLKTYRLEMPTVSRLGWKEPLNIFKKQNHLATSLNPFGLCYKDSIFSLLIKPVYSVKYLSNENGNMTATGGGIDAMASIAGHWGVYASLRDNHESELQSRPSYFVQDMGGAFKENNGGRSGGDFSEMRAGITYAWKWGDIGLAKDHFSWGSNQNGSNIFSGRTPSFAHIRLHIQPTKWLEFNYVHGWLVSELIDSTRSYYNAGKYKAAFRQKFMAANFITVTPFKKFSISAGNSIIYSDLGGVHAAYLIPVAFYKSIDHTLNHGIENQNSQLFFDLSSRQIKHLHLYASMFVDEFSVTRLKSSKSHNFISWKGGLQLSNFPLKNIVLGAEFTQTTPITYKHDIAAVTFASNSYNLGHYLRDNSREIYLSVAYSPLPRLHAELSYTLAEHGGEYAYLRSDSIADLPMLTDMSWKMQQTAFSISYQFISNSFVYLNYVAGNIEGFDLNGSSADYYLELFTAPMMRGKTKTLTLGFSLGF